MSTSLTTKHYTYPKEVTMTRPQTDRYLVKIAPAGETFIVEASDDGTVYASTIALHVEEWSGNDGYDPKPDLDLYDFHLEPLDEPESDEQYTYLFGPEGDMR